jgi:hypothetical protein
MIPVKAANAEIAAAVSIKAASSIIVRREVLL